MCVSQPVGTFMPHPSLERCCLKKSLAANLMAFSGVTSVKFTAAPGRIKKDREQEREKNRERRERMRGNCLQQ